MEWMTALFGSSNFMPHGHCFLWTPLLLWTFVLADSAIALAYYSIPAAIIYGVRRRRDEGLNRVALMFGAFIFACGTTHLISVVTIWYPWYGLDAVARVVTAAISVVTAIALWPVVRKVSRYVSNRERATEQLSEANLQLRDMLDTLETQKRDLQLLNQMSGMLSVCNSMSEVAETITETLRRLFPESAGALYLAALERDDFDCESQWGGRQFDATIAGNDCWAHRLGRLFPDSDNPTRVRCTAGDCGMATGRVCIPVGGGGEIVALLQLEGVSCSEDSAERAIIDVLVERAGLAMHNIALRKELEYESTRDPLTGLFNRRYLEEALRVEAHRTDRGGPALSIALFDLDRFKQLNDSFGHPAGDAALKFFADVVESCLRNGDVPCRFGGEEFIVVLPATTQGEALNVAERVRSSLEAAAAKAGEPSLKTLTVSGGIAMYGGSGDTVEAMVERADKAVYEAKAAGRNSIRPLAPTPG